MERIVGGAVALVVLLIAFCIWQEVAHPCVRRGPPKTTEYMMQSCGEGCWYMMPIETSQCLERAE